MSHVRPMRGDVMDQPTEKYWKPFSFVLLEILPYGKLQLLARMAVQSLFSCTTKVRGEFSAKQGNEFFKKPSFTISSSTIGFSLKAFPHKEEKIMETTVFLWSPSGSPQKRQEEFSNLKSQRYCGMCQTFLIFEGTAKSHHLGAALQKCWELQVRRLRVFSCDEPIASAVGAFLVLIDACVQSTANLAKHLHFHYCYNSFIFGNNLS